MGDNVKECKMGKQSKYDKLGEACDTDKIWHSYSQPRPSSTALFREFKFVLMMITFFLIQSCYSKHLRFPILTSLYPILQLLLFLVICT